jgi:hypothetical protein
MPALPMEILLTHWVFSIQEASLTAWKLPVQSLDENSLLLLPLGMLIDPV